MQFLQSVPGLDRHKDFVAADLSLRLLSGGLAGVTAASMTYPLDLVRTRLAAQVTNLSSYPQCLSVMLFPINLFC